jgi:flagellar hook-associated protein 2
MATSSGSIDTSTGSLLSVTGLASGLDTGSIISALMGAERLPVTRLTNQQSKLQAEETAMQTLKNSLQQLSFAAADFNLPSLFESSQTVTSSEPTRVSASTTAGAGVGGYEVEVTQLANSAQRTFTFASPEAEDTITVDGQEFTIKAGATAKEVAKAINSNSAATVYAAALENGTIVLSNRKTGSTGGTFIEVSDPGGALTEVAASAKEGKDAEFTVDGVAQTASSNTVTTAIAGVTLTLQGLTPSGPVTIDVQPPGASVSNIEEKVQAFISLYNSTVEAIETQLTTKPPSNPQKPEEFATGTLFGDVELQGLLSNMRAGMYEPIAGLEAGMSSPHDIGVTTGTPAGTTSHKTLEGLLTLNTATLAEAVKSNPAAAQKMLQQWAQKISVVIEDVGGPTGGLAARANGDATQVTELARQITNMNELLAQKEKALQATYAKMEAAISQTSAQSSWLTRQTESLFSSKS